MFMTAKLFFRRKKYIFMLSMKSLLLGLHVTIHTILKCLSLFHLYICLLPHPGKRLELNRSLLFLEQISGTALATATRNTYRSIKQPSHQQNFWASNYYYKSIVHEQKLPPQWVPFGPSSIFIHLYKNAVIGLILEQLCSSFSH